MNKPKNVAKLPVHKQIALGVKKPKEAMKNGNAVAAGSRKK